MRKWTVPMLVALLLFGAKTASADVFVAADVVKLKDIKVVENLTVTKTMLITAVHRAEAEKAAQADVIVDQVNINNEACANCDEKRDVITGAGNNNSGVVSVNQAAGNMNNQGNAVSVAVDVFGVTPPPPGTTPDPDAGTGLAHSQSALEQENGVWAKFQLELEPLTFENASFNLGPVVPGGNSVNTVDILFRDAVITESFNGNSGIVHANQSAGNMNNQANGLAIAVSIAGEGAALSEADLGQVNVLNSVGESDAVGSTLEFDEDGNFVGVNPAPIGINKSVRLVSSVNGNSGIVGLNQTAGNLANQANNVSFSTVVP